MSVLSEEPQPNPGISDLIFVSLENWDDIWRRNQFVCAELARRYPQMRILFLGTQRNVWHHLKGGKWRGLFKGPTFTVPGFPNITVTRALRIAPERYGWGRKVNDLLTSSHLRRAKRRCGIGKFILWLNPHYSVPLVGRMGELAVIYDITDDWMSLNQASELTERIKRQDLELCARADAVIVCSSRLYKMKVGMTRHLHLIPNGVNADHYRDVLNSKAPRLAISNGWSKPVLGYTGTVHPDRVDLDLVIDLAGRFPGGTLVLVGPDMIGERDRQRLRSVSNIVLTGQVPYAEIPDYMRCFDVCIVPHRMTPFTESLNPIKLWEYLAAGKPIVSTNVAGFRDYPELVRIAVDAESFAGEVGMALEEPAELPERRRAEAAQHSWSSRVDQIEVVMQSCVAATYAKTKG